MKTNTRNICTIAVFAAALLGCGGARTGTVELRVTNTNPVPVTISFAKILVTIDHVDAHTSGGKWQTVVSKPQTLDLSTLAGGSFATIGIATVPSGHLTELRLYLSGSASVVTLDGSSHALEVPSGDIKIVGFEVAECRTNAATISFEGVEYHAADGKYVLRPTVQLAEVSDDGPGACDDVTDDTNETETDSPTK